MAAVAFALALVFIGLELGDDLADFLGVIVAESLLAAVADHFDLIVLRLGAEDGGEDAPVAGGLAEFVGEVRAV